MPEVKLALTGNEAVCVESISPPAALVVFGASGDLVRRKLLISLLRLHKQGLLSEQFYFIGCGRKQLSDSEFQEIVRKAVAGEDIAPKQIEAFARRFYYVSGAYEDAGFYEDIKKRLSNLESTYKVGGSVIFYLSVPPFLYPSIVEQLGKAGLSGLAKSNAADNVKLVVEKPFGRDLQSATELNEQIRRYFNESQIYRIDHYLGKETVQNILMFRFANSIFEPVWNRNYIDHVQITIAESMGIEHRGGYYDKAGALRDMFQNHMLQMLALVAMEPPTSFEADRIRDEKVKLLRSIRPFKIGADSTNIVRGQYGPGVLDGKKVTGYRQEQDVADDSKTETFVAAKMWVDNWRWKNVPFYLRTGKRLSHKDTEIAITFRKVPHSMFVASGLGDMPRNVLVMQIQPEEGISLNFEAKRPGSKICMGTLNMSFSYRSVFGVKMPEAYQRLLSDCMHGDQTLFTRQDDVDATWRLLTPLLELWAGDGSAPHEYPAGSESFAAADNLIESDSRQWRKLCGD